MKHVKMILNAIVFEVVAPERHSRVARKGSSTAGGVYRGSPDGAPVSVPRGTFGMSLYPFFRLLRYDTLRGD